MAYTVIAEWLLFEKYRVLKLDCDIHSKAHAKCLIDGKVYELEYLHYHTGTVMTPLNLIAIKTKDSFIGTSVEFV